MLLPSLNVDHTVTSRHAKAHYVFPPMNFTTLTRHPRPHHDLDESCSLSTDLLTRHMTRMPFLATLRLLPSKFEPPFTFGLKLKLGSLRPTTPENWFSRYLELGKNSMPRPSKTSSRTPHFFQPLSQGHVRYVTAKL